MAVVVRAGSTALMPNEKQTHIHKWANLAAMATLTNSCYKSKQVKQMTKRLSIPNKSTDRQSFCH